MSEILDNPAGRPVIVGTGIAGLVAALCLSPQPVLLITRASLGAAASSVLAQGGLAAALGEDDSSALHLADTLAAGDGLCDGEVSEGILRDAPAAVALLEAFGVRFDREASGALAMGLEAAHCRRRILHAGGDRSGAAIVQALVDAVRATPSIAVLEGVAVERLLTDETGAVGLLCRRNGRAIRIPSRATVLATGGIGDLYEASTNPIGSFGQGLALAARAGARLADLEFVQFHPTALATDRRPLALVSEAVRGEGAILVNERGERFMRGIAGAELAPRDVVARAIAAEIARGGQAYLDARHALGSRFAARFPGIAALLAEAGLDPARDLLPVRPAAHYHMGGIATDASGQSSITGLFAIGEVACTGLHGANRLASNSLLEAVVMGMRVANTLAGERPQRGLSHRLPDADLPAAADPATVRPLVSRHLSVLRRQAGLQAALDGLLPLAEGQDPALVGALIAAFALSRQESRGAHMRLDCPSKTGDPGVRQILTASEAFALAQQTRQTFHRSA